MSTIPRQTAEETLMKEVLPDATNEKNAKPIGGPGGRGGHGPRPNVKNPGSFLCACFPIL